ncbi:MAG TPA: SDR family oxidoreductase [Thermoanaerobaculia bacterium]|nr:SDR family oxidoreductase [Thermoanaerobaculia bacterium]
MKQTALITGASSGIGLDLAHLFARDGHDVVLVARSQAKLQALAKELEAHHHITAHVVPADLSEEAAPRKLFETIRDRGLTIDVLVNNAGFGTGGAFADTDLKTELDMIQVNVTAVTHLTKLFLGGMIARGRGRILNVASTAGFQPGPFMAVYYATKAYVVSFSEAIAEELSGTGVTVTALCPGPTATGFAEVANIKESPLFKLSKPMASMDVARIGYQAMQRGKRVAVTGLQNKIAMQSLRVSPRAVVTKVVRSLNRGRAAKP